ncbi:hypothetical protein DFA_03404 [Cavenderia fasciculata]|uniref:Uncharacterized protein n=1 Tax=Cavenderia fasciculata TaxID=261658 RepID=F4PHH2_CACFS|nr:uncharacterized protein DFA_03404 [Cavenderia fasciculata]EGG25156.1 hypothetical protein DFA_03404 [Cavenderia fasciculata]|eukprot:XP_004363007.1 hypothetical protein DFA_03404 [Cavenderia fasciculata]
MRLLMTSFIHKKAKQVKKNLLDSTSIKKWDCLHVEHDHIDHQLDIKLLNAITSIVNESYSTSTTSSSIYTSNTQQQQQSDHHHHHQHQHEQKRNRYILNLIGQQQFFQPLLQKIESFKNQLESFENLYGNDGMIGEGDLLKPGTNKRAELNPTITYKTGKQLLLSNLVVDQLVLLVDLLLMVESEITSAQDYWTKRTDSRYWYLFEKTPFFWVQYYYSLWNSKLSFEKTLHKSIGFNSSIVTFNQYQKKATNYIKKTIFKRDDNNNNNTQQQQELNDNPSDEEFISDEENNDNQQNHNNNNNNNNNNNQDNTSTTTKIKRESILHPIKELTKRIKTLTTISSNLSIAIGRLTYSLSLFENGETNNNTNSIGLSDYIIDTCELLFKDQDENQQQQEEEDSFAKSYQEWKKKCDYSQSSSIDKLNESLLEEHQKDLFNLLKENTISIQSMVLRGQDAIRDERPPSWMVRNWSKILIGTSLTVFGARYAYSHRQEFKTSVMENYQAWRRFSREHIETPLLNIWNVIRYDQKSMNVTDPAALQSSLDSLTRMVTDFCKETQSNMSQAEIDSLVHRVALGDLSDIMKPYELNIRAPIKSALFGDFLRLALIQVQKEKVDVDRAMLAIDKLLQSNELNFQLLAAIPSVLIVWTVIWKINDSFSVKESKNTVNAQKSILSTLRSIHRRLTITKHTSLPDQIVPITTRVASTFYRISLYQPPLINDDEKTLLEQQKKPFEEYGQLLILIERMKHYAKHLNNNKNSQEREWIHQDLQDLESEHLGNNEKLLTIQRMFSTYSFLKK